jgi:hypothetical protein
MGALMEDHVIQLPTIVLFGNHGRDALTNWWYRATQGEQFARWISKEFNTPVGVDTTEKLLLQAHVVERVDNLVPIRLDGEAIAKARALHVVGLAALLAVTLPLLIPATQSTKLQLNQQHLTWWQNVCQKPSKIVDHTTLSSLILAFGSHVDVEEIADCNYTLTYTLEKGISHKLVLQTSFCSGYIALYSLLRPAGDRFSAAKAMRCGNTSPVNQPSL